MRFTNAVIIFVVALCSSTRADYIYNFEQTNYEVLPNSTVDVRVFLTQISPGLIDLTTDGIVSAGVRVYYNDNAPSERAQVLSLADIIPSHLLEEPLLGPIGDLQPGVSAAFAAGVEDIFVPVTGESIFLGTFRFTSGSVVGEVTNLRAADFGSMGQTIGGDFDLSDIDSLIAEGNATITVTAVPEPSSLILVSTAIAGLLAHRRRRKKTAARTTLPSG